MTEARKVRRVSAAPLLRRRISRCVRSSAIALSILPASVASASVVYTYDSVGRVTTALYDNNVCVVYTYDANGNRTSQVVNAAGPGNSTVWGTGVYGCFHWSS